jgi:hypothetical protein
MPFPVTLRAMQEAGYKRQSYSRCKGCKQPMEWWTTPTGARIPMEPMPLDDSPAVSHWATCPKAADFRRSQQPCSHPDDSLPLFPSSAPPQFAVKQTEKKGSE